MENFENERNDKGISENLNGDNSFEKENIGDNQSWDDNEVKQLNEENSSSSGAQNFNSTTYQFQVKDNPSNENTNQFSSDANDCQDERMQIYLNKIDQYNRQIALRQEKKQRQNSRLPLIFSLVGLLCCLFFGVGIVFSVIGLVTAIINNVKKPSITHKWAIVVSIVGIALSILFVLGVGYAVFLGVAEKLKQSGAI